MSKKNVVFMLAVKVPQYPWRSEPYKYGIASWKKWCDKNNCELFVLILMVVMIGHSVVWRTILNIYLMARCFHFGNI